jgi:probable phosphoglycerate mutase
VIYFIRHGETEWSLTGQHTGRTDIPLTPHGESQARALKPRLDDISFAAVVSSPMQRALQTCELSGLTPTEVEPGLDEWDYGTYEGQTSSTIRNTHPDWNVFRDGCPGGELPSDIRIRADRVITHLRSVTGNVAVFSHGQFGEALAARWIGLAVVEGKHLHLDPATVSILDFDTAHPSVPIISLWNSSGALPGKQVAL